MDTTTVIPTPSAANGTPSAQCALYVALQTMKERCLNLQQRLTISQEEILTLRQSRSTSNIPAGSSGDQNTLQEMRSKVEELTLAKDQLNDRLNMVAMENRQLWSRLSHITKATTATPKPKPESIPSTSGANQNLIRSKTFTQNAPNPALRSKMQPEVNADLSLEEISLKVLNDMMESKAELEKFCGDLTTPDITTANTYGFGYLNEDDGNGDNVALTEALVGEDVHLELKRCSDGMFEIRKEVLRQQSDIKVALSNLRKKRCNYSIIILIYSLQLLFYF